MNRCWKLPCPNLHSRSMVVRANHNMGLMVATQGRGHLLSKALVAITLLVRTASHPVRSNPREVYSLLTTLDSRTPKPQYPPQSGPQPFTYAGQAPPPQQQQPQYPSHDPRNRIPSGNQGPSSTDPYSHRPQSTYDNPQELSSSSYATPTDTRPQVYPPHIQPSKPESDHSPSLHSPTDGEPYGQAQQSQPAHAGQQTPYPQTPVGPTSTQNQFAAYNQAPPSQAPPQPPSPSMGQNPYPVLNSGPPSGGYQAYHASPSQQQSGYVAEAQGNPSDFYR